jgi:cytochrome b6-f complex iron-sulfur subunit
MMDTPNDDCACNTLSRRTFLRSTALVVLPALCGGCGGDGAGIIDLPKVASNTIIIPLDAFPMLAEVNGSVVGKADGHENPIIIAHVDHDTFVAVDALCTHMQCTVSYNALGVTFDCPCHESTYEIDGRVIGGPAIRPLRAFPVRSDGANLTITLS